MQNKMAMIFPWAGQPSHHYQVACGLVSLTSPITNFDSKSTGCKPLRGYWTSRGLARSWVITNNFSDIKNRNNSQETSEILQSVRCHSPRVLRILVFFCVIEIYHDICQLSVPGACVNCPWANTEVRAEEGSFLWIDVWIDLSAKVCIDSLS